MQVLYGLTSTVARGLQIQDVVRLVAALIERREAGHLASGCSEGGVVSREHI